MRGKIGETKQAFDNPLTWWDIGKHILKNTCKTLSMNLEKMKS